MSEDLLEAFLKTQSREGRFFDTSTFTIDSVKALQKLGQHQFADSGLWLVKLVQAAVASGSDQIAIAFAHRRVSVVFTGCADWQADNILETVLSGTLPKERALRHLVTGIRACASSPNEAVKWSCGRAEVDLARNCRVTEQPPSALFSLTASRPARSRSWSKVLTSSVKELSKGVVEEFDALHSRCWLCPIPITIDGVRMPAGVDLVKGGGVKRKLLRLTRREDGYILSACLGYRYLNEPETEATLVPFSQSSEVSPSSESPYRVAKLVHRYETFLTWARTDRGYRGAVALITHPFAESQIELLHDGVVIQSHPLPGLTIEPPLFPLSRGGSQPPLAVRFIFPLSQEQLDLSGFAVQESVSINEMMYACFPPLLEMADALIEQSKAFNYLPYTPLEMAAFRIGTASGALLLGAVTHGLGLPVVAGTVWAFVAINRAQWQRQLRIMMKALRDRLQDNLKARDEHPSNGPRGSGDALSP